MLSPLPCKTSLAHPLRVSLLHDSHAVIFNLQPHPVVLIQSDYQNKILSAAGIPPIAGGVSQRFSGSEVNHFRLQRRQKGGPLLSFLG